MARARISLAKEDRIADLWSQGYRFDEIARICNCSEGAVRGALKRYGRRWRWPDDERKGRQRSFLSDAEVEEIYFMRGKGLTYEAIGSKFYGLSAGAIHNIINGKSYQEPEDSYPFDFSNNLRRD